MQSQIKCFETIYNFIRIKLSQIPPKTNSLPSYDEKMHINWTEKAPNILLNRCLYNNGMNATEFQLLLYSIALRTLSHSPFNNKTLKQYINIIAKLSALAINTVDSNICVGGTFLFLLKKYFFKMIFSTYGLQDYNIQICIYCISSFIQ